MISNYKLIAKQQHNIYTPIPPATKEWPAYVTSVSSSYMLLILLAVLKDEKPIFGFCFTNDVSTTVIYQKMQKIQQQIHITYLFFQLRPQHLVYRYTLEKQIHHTLYTAH